ncbi:MAG: MoaD/ThiS family protein [Promethearchaeota archaeon]
MTVSHEITIKIPTPLRAFTDNQKTVAVKGKNVGEALLELVNTYPKLKKHLYNDTGLLRNYVNIYLNDEDIRYLGKEDSVLHNGDILAIIPSIAGGR